MAMANGTGSPHAGHGAALVQDPTLLRAYSALKTVQMMGITDAGLHLRAPMIVVCGTQSSGKTSFIETLIGFPVGHTDRGTATRCPVRYILRSGEAAYRANNAEVATREGVRVAVKRHMEEFQGQGRIVADVLVVEISEPGMIDLDITDLPGLKTRDEPEYKPIAEVVKSFLRDPSVMPVVMCKASESHQTQHDLDSMRDVGLNVSRSLVVMNYFNKQIGDMSHISDLNRYCSGQRGKYPMVRFVMLHYKEGINKERMSFEELSEYYRSLPGKEEEAFEARVAAMQPDDLLDPSVRKNFGVTSVFTYMQRLLHDWMRKHHAEVRGWLQERLAVLNGQLAELRAALKQQDPQSIAQMWRNYVLDFERVMAAVHSATLTNVKRLSRESIFAPKYQWAFTMDEVGVTTTFDDERAMLQSVPPEHWLSSDQLREELVGTHTSELLDDALSSHAAFHRLVLVASYMIMALPMRPFTKDEIRSKSEHSRDGITHSFNKHTVVKQLVTERLFHLQNILAEMMLHIRAIYEAPLPKIREALSENYPVVSHHDDFLCQLDGKFKQLLTRYLDKANSSMQDVIEEKTRFFGVDLPNRLLTLLALTPLRQDVLLLDPRAAYEEEEEAVKTERVLENIAGAASNVLDDPTPKGVAVAGLRLLNKSYGALRKGWQPQGTLRKTPVVLARSRNPDIPERLPHQREAVLNVKRALHKWHSQFCLVDFSEGGLQDLSMDEYRCPNVDELNKDGEQYFLILKGMIALDVEVKLDRNVYEPLKNKLLLDAMTKEMMQVVDTIVEDESEMSRITGNNAERLAKDIAAAEEQAGIVRDALDRLQSVGGASAPETLEVPRGRGARPGLKTGSKPCVDGVARLPNMELGRLPTAFRTNFMRAAEKDISLTFAYPAALVRVTDLHGGSIHVDYALEAREKGELPRIKATVDRALRGNVSFVNAGRVYCQAIGADAGCAQHFGCIQTHAAPAGPEVGWQTPWDELEREHFEAPAPELSDEHPALRDVHPAGLDESKSGPKPGVPESKAEAAEATRSTADASGSASSQKGTGKGEGEGEEGEEKSGKAGESAKSQADREEEEEEEEELDEPWAQSYAS